MAMKATLVVANQAHDRIDCVLIAGGKYHDIDFARLELLKLLAEDERVRVRVFEDYRNVDAIDSAHFWSATHAMLFRGWKSKSGCDPLSSEAGVGLHSTAPTRYCDF